MPSKLKCTTVSGTPQEQWRQVYGTETFGNLPQYKVFEHTGHSWVPCPYSTQSSDLRTEHLLGLPLPIKVDHTDATGRVYYMKTDNRGKWGYSCTFKDCPYNTNNGRPYFYA